MKPRTDAAEAEHRVARLAASAVRARGGPLSDASRDQLRRWGPAIVAACDRLGLDVRDADRPALVTRVLESSGLTIDLPQAQWAIRRLAAAERELGPRRTTTRGFAAITDAIPGGSRLGKAISRRLDAAPSQAQRRARRSLIGRFLAWCEATDRSPETTYPGELFAYRRACVAADLVPDVPVCEARSLLRELDPVVQQVPSPERVRWSSNARITRTGEAPTGRFRPSSAVAASATLTLMPSRTVRDRHQGT